MCHRDYNRRERRAGECKGDLSRMTSEIYDTTAAALRWVDLSSPLSLFLRLIAHQMMSTSLTATTPPRISEKMAFSRFRYFWKTSLGSCSGCHHPCWQRNMKNAKNYPTENSERRKNRKEKSFSFLISFPLIQICLKPPLHCIMTVLRIELNNSKTTYVVVVCVDIALSHRTRTWHLVTLLPFLQRHC